MNPGSVLTSAMLLQASPFAGLAAQSAIVEGVVVAAERPAVEVVVYLLPDPRTPLPVAADTPSIDQVNLRYVPAVLPALPNTVVEFRNSDPILHNVFSPPGPGSGFDLGTYPRTESRTHTFRETGTHVILCHVHPEMYAYVVVVPSPHYAVPDEDLRFRIEGVPAGRYRVKVWRRSEQEFSPEISLREGDRVSLRLDLSARTVEIRGR